MKISTDPVAFVRVVGESVVVDPARIDVTYCKLDSNIIVLEETFGGVEAIIDDDVLTPREVLDDGSARATGVQPVSQRRSMMIPAHLSMMNMIARRGLASG